MRFEKLSDEPGTLTIVPDTVAASRRVSLKIIFRSGICLGPGACLRFHIPQAFTSPQVDSPLKPGFCRIRDDPKFRFSLSLKRTGSDKDEAYVTRWGKCIYATLESGTVRSGDEITLLYGEKASEAERAFGSVPGTFAPFFSGNHPVQFALDANGKRESPFSGMIQLKTLRYIRVLPRKAVRSEVCRRAEESREVYFDRYGNPVSVSVRKEKNDFSLGNGLSVYFGDLHCHSFFSDGLGTPEECYSFARDTAALDFCSVTDHSQEVSDREWLETCKAAETFNRDGQFVTLAGYEFSHPEAGEKNLYYPASGGPMLRELDFVTGRVFPIESCTGSWIDHHALMMMHLHGRHLNAFRNNGLCRLLEIYSNWGSAERQGSEPLFIPALRSEFEGNYAVDALNSGFIVGFTANSDDHMARPGLSGWHRVERVYRSGLTGVYAKELTRKGIFDALYRRHTFATTGVRIVTGVSLNGHLPGEEFRAEKSLLFSFDIRSPVPLREMAIVTCFCEEKQSFPAGVFRYRAEKSLPARNGWYYIRIRLRDGNLCWISPFYVKAPEAGTIQN